MTPPGLSAVGSIIAKRGWLCRTEYPAVVTAINEVQRVLPPEVFAAEFGMSLSDLAKYARVDQTTIVRIPNDPSLQAFLRNCLLVTDKMQLTFERPLADVVPWFREGRLSAFRGASALEMVAQGRATAVLTYLDTISSGFVG